MDFLHHLGVVWLKLSGKRMDKESITLNMELAKTQCYELECFEDNYSLTTSTQAKMSD